MFVVPGLTSRQWINDVFFQPFPIYAAITQRVLGRSVKDSTDSGGTKNSEADMPFLRRAYGFAAAAPSSVYLYLWIASRSPLGDIFFKNIGNPSAQMALVEGAAKVLRYDQIAAFSAGAARALLSVGNLKRARILNAGWGRIVGVLEIATLVPGPGAGIAVMWAWGEEVLVGRKVGDRNE